MAFDDYEITNRPMTSDEVFASLVDFQRDEFGNLLLGEATRETSVRELFNTFEVGTWADVANALNRLFDLQVSHADWRPILLPKRKRTLGGLCDFISQQATIPVIQPVNVMGDRSLAAGAFLVVRRIFAEAGANVTDLRPSSQLTRYWAKLNDALPRLIRAAPGRLPRPTIDAPVQEGLGWVTFLGLGVAIYGGCCHVAPMHHVAGFLAAVACFVATWICNDTVGVRAVRFGTARTFADLARVIAGERCAWPGFPVVMR